MITLTLDESAFRNSLKQLAYRDAKIASSWAMNDAAEEAFGEPRNLPKLAAHISEVLDNPTTFTKNAFFMRGARPDRLEVSIERKKGQARRHYLEVQETGGGRPQTGVERQLTLATPEAAYAVIPADEARLDAHGNWSRGERNQVLSALKVGRDVGYTSNATVASTRRGKKRGRNTYFVPKRGTLPPGIYKRTPKGDLGIVAVFTAKAPRYEARLDFHPTVEREFFKRLPGQMDRALAKMIARRRG